MVDESMLQALILNDKPILKFFWLFNRGFWFLRFPLALHFWNSFIHPEVNVGLPGLFCSQTPIGDVFNRAIVGLDMFNVSLHATKMQPVIRLQTWLSKTVHYRKFKSHLWLVFLYYSNIFYAAFKLIQRTRYYIRIGAFGFKLDRVIFKLSGRQSTVVAFELRVQWPHDRTSSLPKGK